ncbi:glutaredoxin 3 [Basilea psittacipulmonis]|uniref:Glutaredoxin n=1 Tax=Basilea psittacipulmonis DSM 24701 TaxID=1072685 RepID=A0A077DD45_9BURK|nr:glutaredoxin 3 [Basilea psittacipulmonis]AIL32096.1 glutaredoxin [Basilea psittacipulmonis DSM 24701]
MKNAVTIYYRPTCPYCQKAFALLESKGVTNITKIDISSLPSERDVMIERSGRTTVPQIFIGTTHVGGCDDLYALDAQGKLDTLLH